MTQESTAEKQEATANYERQRQRIEDRLEHLRAQSASRSASAAEALDHAHAKLVGEQRKRREIDSQLQDENRLATALRTSMEDEKAAGCRGRGKVRAWHATGQIRWQPTIQVLWPSLINLFAAPLCAAGAPRPDARAPPPPPSGRRRPRPPCRT